MKWPCVFSLLAFAIAFPQISVAAPQTEEIAVKVIRGWVRQKDGTNRDVSGLILPATLEKIEAHPVSRKSLKRKKVGGSLKNTAFGRFVKSLSSPVYGTPLRPVMMDTTVYQADAGAGYAYLDPLEFDDPSSLDDLGTSGGAGIPWKNLQFGFHCEGDLMSPQPFVFVAWEAFSTYNPNTTGTQSAFSGKFADHAIALPAPTGGPGSYKMTIDVSAMGAVSPGNTMYVAQQFWQDNEENFDFRYRNVYNAAAAPTVGSSQNQFWYDWDPLDNTFSNNELDVLSGEGSQSNHLRTLTVDGTTEHLSALSYTVVKGREPLGDLLSLGASDDDYLSVRPTLFTTTGVAPIQVEVQGISTGTTATNLKFRLETNTQSGGATQRVSLFNYATNQYELLDTRAATTSDNEVTIEVVSNAARFIAPSGHSTPRRVKALVAFSPGAFSTSTWRSRIDKVSWTIVR